VIQKQLVDRLALKILEGEFSEGDAIEVAAADGDLTVEKTASPA
jgi:ATP-dependent Clp protease ATP-binding subunit ClpA